MLVYARNESYLTDSEIIFRGAKEGVDYLQDLFNKSKLKHGDNWDLIKEDVFDYYKSISKDDPRAPLKRFTKIDEKGPIEDGNINWPGGSPTYEIVILQGKPKFQPVVGDNRSSFGKSKKGKIVFGDDEKTVPRTNLFENSNQVMTSVHYRCSNCCQ
jgi:adenine-specific DNA-methyltransferase